MNEYNLFKFGKLFLMYKDHYNEEGLCIMNINQEFKTQPEIRKWLRDFAKAYFERFPEGSPENTLYIENEKNVRYASIDRGYFIWKDEPFNSDREIDTDFYSKTELEEFKIADDLSGDHLNIKLPETGEEDHT